MGGCHTAIGTFPWERAWAKDTKYNRVSKWRAAGSPTTLVPWSLFGPKLWGVLDRALDPDPTCRPPAHELRKLLDGVDWRSEYRAFRASWREWTSRHGVNGDPTLDPSEENADDSDDADVDDATSVEALGMLISEGMYLGATKVKECVAQCVVQ